MATRASLQGLQGEGEMTIHVKHERLISFGEGRRMAMNTAADEVEATLTEWKADRVGGDPGRDAGPGEWDAIEFIHHDRKIVEHWVLHQRMRKPGVLYEIYEVTTVLRETL